MSSLPKVIRLRATRTRLHPAKNSHPAAKTSASRSGAELSCERLNPRYFPALLLRRSWSILHVLRHASVPVSLKLLHLCLLIRREQLEELGMDTGFLHS